MVNRWPPTFSVARLPNELVEDIVLSRYGHAGRFEVSD